MVTHLLVGNPTAQSGKNGARIAKARDALTAHGIESDFLSTLPEGKTVGAVHAALEKGHYRCVISMGGDGTFREVAAGLLAAENREGIALGMLPTGTANDQGRSFGLHATPDDLDHNVRVIADGHETRIDAGEILTWTDHHRVKSHFFDSAGWGISARVLAARNADRKLVEGMPIIEDIYRDQLVYVGAALRVFAESFLTPDTFDVRIQVDGHTEKLTGLTDIVIKNTRVYGGIWVLDRTSKHDDGFFEVVPFRGKRDWTSKAIVDIEGNPLTEEMLNSIGVEHSKPFRASRILMQFDVPEGNAPLAAQIDGEEFHSATFVDVHVYHQALRLIVPTLDPK